MAGEVDAAAHGRDLDDSIIVALGSNLAAEGCGSEAVVEAALGALAGRGVRVLHRSRIWRSAAWPDHTQPAYANLVALVESRQAPADLLAVLHTLEAAFGRVRAGPNAPRTLDLDLIAYGRRLCAHAPILPHPRAAERLFVMGPLAEIAPRWRHPVLGETAEALARKASVGRDAAPLIPAAPDPGRGRRPGRRG